MAERILLKAAQQPEIDGSLIAKGAMTRDARHLGDLSIWRGHCFGLIVMLIAWIPLWLSPSVLFSSVTHSAAVHHAKPPRRGVGTPDPSRLPNQQMQFFGRHTASEPDESVESAAQCEAPTFGRLPRLRSQQLPVIFRLGAMSLEARLSVLQSLGLPLIC